MKRKEGVQRITACAFLYQGDKFFTAKRADTKEFLPGKYELPGGHVDYGEELEEGLKRELNEEFGIEVVVGKPVYAFTYLNPVKKSHSVEIVFLCQLKNSQTITLDPQEHSDYTWVSRDNLDEYFSEDDDEYHAALAGFEAIGV